ncbi:MAG: hypothetical protein FJ145_06995 [Deltaproteobacteria bacterium]|nr:hypothetical protein [Deltaproteobacteria bacterium]
MIRIKLLLIILSCLLLTPGSLVAQTIQQLVAAAKQEKEIDFVAGPTTFGGRKGLAEIEAAL